MQIFRNDQRGSSRTEWLASRHSFAFGNYYADDRQGFSALRALNEHELLPETGFPTQSLRDMEILSYVLAGELAHKDSEGNVVRLPAGEFQLLSSGTGVRQTESNPLAARKLRFLQIWIQPNLLGLTPAYQQRAVKPEPGLTLVASPNGASGSLGLRQDLRVYRLQMKADERASLAVARGRRAYVHLINGRMQLESDEQVGLLDAGDGAALEAVSELRFIAEEGNLEALVFDLP